VSAKRKSGVLSCQELKKAIEEGIITSKAPIDEGQIQPASIDLRLGGKAYALVSSLLPEKGQKVVEILHTADMYGSDLVKYPFDITDGGILERGIVYLIPLMEELKLPKDVGGKVNPKSTTGRLDIFTRVITDGNPRFDHIDAGYKGKLYLEVMPRSFTIMVKEGLSLAQLRLRNGKCYVDDESLEKLHSKKRLLYIGDNHVPPGKVRYSHGIFMSMDLQGDPDGIIGYKAKKNSHVVDLTKRNYYNIDDFWEPIYKNPKRTLILEPEEFYILASREKIRIPPDYAADMAPYEAGFGELRTHYAGFFDPGFGYGASGKIKGTKAVLEVRAHDVPFMIVHGQTFCKLFFEKMMEVPEKVYGPKIGSSYQYQGITLSKQFKNH
jgi:dCTP deaminase